MLGFIEKNNNLSRKDREKLLKKHEILSASTKLFAHQGFDKTTLDEIAEAAEFGKGTIYNYFKSKEDIYQEILDLTITSFFEMLVETDKNTDSFSDFFSSLIKSMFLFCEKDKDTFNLFVRMRTDHPINKPCEAVDKHQELYKKSFAIYEKRINNAVKNKEIRPVAVNPLMQLIRSVVFPYIHFLVITSTEEINYDKEAEFVISVLANGIFIK